LVDFNFRFGKYLSTFERWKRDGKKTPEIPVLYDDLTEIYIAFADLSATRRYTDYGVPQFIQVSEIEAWLNIHEIVDYELRLYYYRLIRACDRAYIKAFAENENMKGQLNADSQSIG